MRIFTRINNDGIKLSNLKIIYSIIKSSWKTDARQEIDKLINSVKNMGFNIDIEYVTKAFIFLYSKTVKNEIKVFNDVFCKKIENEWEKINKSILCLFRLLQSFKFTGDTLTSKNATLPVLYYIHHKNLYNNFDYATKFEHERKEIRKWLCVVLLRKVFSGQSDTALSQARKAFNADFDKKIYIYNKMIFTCSAINKNIDRLTLIDDDTLKDILNTQKENSNSTLILSLLYPDKKYYSTIIHKDHIHPKEKAKQAGYTIEQYNTIINLQLLTDIENTQKGTKDLIAWAKENDYLKNKKHFLDEHILPDVDLSFENFPNFCKKREALLLSRLKKLL